MNIFVGNLSFEAKESDVLRAFAHFGQVESVVIVMDKNGKKSRGFGFVEMPDEQEALAAITALQDKEILGRQINVMTALSKKHESEPEDYKKSEPEDPLVYKHTGKFKEGRRTISYLKRQVKSGAVISALEPKFKANPMRWRKKSKWATPYQKPEGEAKALKARATTNRGFVKHKQ
ncbi:MAG: hypothetical protein WCY09_04745 [Candidatus Omnitrophota bacterium]